MIVLDTDHLSYLEWGSEKSAILRERLAGSADQQIVVSVVSYEEQMRGWMALIAKQHDIAGQVEVYRRLEKHLQLYCSVPLLSFTEQAADTFRSLRAMKVRIGTMDLKIAASCLCADALLLTRNTSDFARVAELRFEDWTR